MGWVWVEVECRRAGWHRINFYFMIKFEDRRVKEVEIPVGRLLYDKLKGKETKVVVKE